MLEEIWIFFEQRKKLFAWIFFGLICVFLIVYPIYLFKNKPQVKGASMVTVEIFGAVKKPGVYTLENNKRVEDLIQISGGILKNADQIFVAETINRARILEDGEKVFIPFSKVATQTVSSTPSSNSASSNSNPPKTSSSSQTSVGSLINLNQANLQELDSLPGIGPVYAQRIIDYRTANGGFKSKEEIKEIKGIGDATYEKIKDLISI